VRGRHGENERHHVGQDFAEHDARVAVAEQSSGLDKLAMAHAEHFAAKEAHIARNGCQRNRRDEVEDALTQDR
jgi:hypothetical protein